MVQEEFKWRKFSEELFNYKGSVMFANTKTEEYCVGKFVRETEDKKSVVFNTHHGEVEINKDFLFWTHFRSLFVYTREPAEEAYAQYAQDKSDALSFDEWCEFMDYIVVGDDNVD